MIKYGDLLNEERTQQLLNEKWGAFEGQYDLAKEVAEAVYNMMIHSQNEIVYHTHHDYIKLVQIRLDIDMRVIQPHGMIYGLNQELGKLMIQVNLPPSYVMKDKVFVIEQLVDIVTHELMHGEIFLKKIEHNASRLEDSPSYYDNILFVMRECLEGSLIRKFAVGLYVTYYHEAQALVSQTYNQLIKVLGDEPYTNFNIKKALQSTETYQTFADIIYDLVPFLEEQDDTFIQNELCEPLILFGINFTVKDVRNRIKRMKFMGEHAMRSIMKNAMLIKVNEHKHKKIKDLI